MAFAYHATLHTMKQYRKEYKKDQLERQDLMDDPRELFRQWFGEAGAVDIAEPNRMILSTATPQGRVSSRVVLLKEISSQGYVFYTNYESDKAQQIDSNPRVALLFHWEVLERQVRIEGSAKRISEERSQAYYDTRPEGSRIGAWTSPQSQIIYGREELEESYKKYEQLYAGKEQIEKPPYWGGFEVVADRYEFWQGRQNRLHDRFVYTPSGAQSADLRWDVHRLAP